MTVAERTAGTSLWDASPAPHLLAARASTSRIMGDVLWALLPVMLAAFWFYRAAAVRTVAVALLVAIATEWTVGRLRGRPHALRDGSVLITALLLAFSLPPQLPVYATALGAFIAVALGKMAFGGLGQNIFNPAMVGRAFLMVCFPGVMTQWSTPIDVHATTQATPLAAAKFAGEYVAWQPLWTGQISGCLGETSAVALLIGGSWLLWRRAADWRLTAGMLLGIAIPAFLEQVVRGPAPSFGWVRHCLAGGALLGAFFIVTDPVTSPLAKPARWTFGLLVGGLTMVIRWFAGYPEGVMFAVLLGNAVSPLLDRWFAPIPVGGKTRRV